MRSSLATSPHLQAKLVGLGLSTTQVKKQDAIRSILTVLDNPDGMLQPVTSCTTPCLLYMLTLPIKCPLDVAACYLPLTLTLPHQHQCSRSQQICRPTFESWTTLQACTGCGRSKFATTPYCGHESMLWLRSAAKSTASHSIQLC